MNNKYELSGKSGNIFLVGILLGPILVTLLCIIYAYIDVYNPMVYLTLLVFIGLLFGIIIIQTIVVKLSKCRSITSSVIYGLIVGLLGIYVSWCTFIYVMFQKSGFPISLIDLILKPSLIFNMASSLSVEGYYSIFSIKVKGGFLWLIWIIEALGLILAGVLGGISVMHEEVFCENCNRWVEDVNLDLHLAIDNKDTAKKIIDSDISKIIDFPNYESVNTEHIKVNLHQCSKCKITSTIDVDYISYETNDKGVIKESKDDFSSVYNLNQSQFDQFVSKKNKQIVKYDKN